MDTTTSGDHRDDAKTTDDRIIHATLNLIAEHGITAVTMSRVADAAGVARQTLYNHYTDINSIMVEAIGRHNRESIDMLEAALRIAESPSDEIEQLVRHYVMVGSHAQHALDFGSGVSAEVRLVLDAYKDSIERHIHRILVDGSQGGHFRPDLEPGIDTTLIRSLLEGLYELAAETPEQASRIVTTGTRTLLAAIR